MITPYSIRLGNVLYHPESGKNIVVSNLNFNEFLNEYIVNGLPISKFEEAEITEDILEAHTEFKLTDCGGYFEDGHKSMRLTPVWYNSIRVDTEDKYFTNIWGLHELQNAYYCKYDEELLQNYLP